MQAGTGKETVALQIGAGALAQCIETVLKSMIPGEEAIVYIDQRAMHELRDMLNEHLVLEIELKTVLDASPTSYAGISAYPLGFSSTMEAANAKKGQGNLHISQKEPLKAVEQYTQGLQLLSTLQNLSFPEEAESKKLIVLLHLNLSAAYLATGATNLVVQHCSNALDLLDHGTPIPDIAANRCKAHFRLGQAYEKASKYQSSLWNYIRAANIQNDPALHQAANRVRPLAEKEKALGGS